MRAVVQVDSCPEPANPHAKDAHAGGDRVVAGEVRRATAVVGAIAGYVDDAPARAKRAFWEQRAAIVDRAADGCAAAEQLARCTLDSGRKCGRRFRFADFG